ncbi:hypothetical protein GCK72_007943 [Caenorhabditis remanei]|uniref:C-type lectin domain-containing protein n=1 Tax=Caenorhabditis remanei TaxID=31234 RepID=A0A6A5HQ96_CAERE|nr:hypothetical protein GCK72_007943 [Caenorhabditis remanei]KAF1767982.1 hypothetical protein GCK72_007943 [Caenorhabditis remanei]
MVSYRLLSVLFILAIRFIGVRGENPEDVPCEEETTTRTTVPSTTPTTTPTTTTIVARTTTRRRCANIRAPVTPFLRKNGYWCSMMFTFGANSTMNYDYQDAVTDCNLNGLVIGSLETDEEKTAYIKLVQETILYDLTAFWVGASLNTTDHKYYWDDGLAVELMDPQPTVVDPNGHVAWFINKNSSVPGYGDYRVVAKTGLGNPKVNANMCGAPGLQF